MHEGVVGEERRSGLFWHLLLSGEEESCNRFLVDVLHSRLYKDFGESMGHHRNKQVEEDDCGEGDVENH